MFLRNGGPNRFAAESNRHDAPRVAVSATLRTLGYFIGFTLALVYLIVVPQLIPESVAYNTAEGIGFTNVEVTSRDWILIQFAGCDKSDSVKFTVTGTNPAGEEQTFYVCAGLFKGGTPRFP
jgi:hypothetical protein